LYACLFLLILTVPISSWSAPQDQVREAQRLRDSGQFAEAVKLLDQRLRQNPDDVEAARLRAQTLYWLKELGRARASYAAALERHPNDERLRVDYARMLAETGDRRGAKALLEPLRLRGQASAHADALLGTILYWDGDLTGAKQLFLDALRKDPAQREAARQLHEIQTISAPWLRLTPTIWHDDQPLDRTGIAIEAGWFLSPLLSVSVRSQPERVSTGVAQTFWNNEVEVSHFAPATRLETLLAAGAFRRPGAQDGFDWTGRAALGLRAGAGVTLRGRLERAAYLHTVSSLESPVMTRTASGMVQWTHPSGWLGEAAVQRQSFPDGNLVRSAHAWLLAPLVHGAQGRLQAGYAVAGADADEDRFVLARPEQPFSPIDPRFDLAGVYRPYYTPARMVSHSAIAAFTAGKTTGPVLRGGGSYGFRAREDATVFQAAGEQVVAVIGRRSYTPWTIRGSLEIPASSSLALTVSGETGRTAFYRWTTARFQVVYRFLSRDPGDAQRR
jgi:tetratricopeptide (TPR) repeat protein